MPKMKTKSSAKKRFKLTGTGKIKRKHALKVTFLQRKGQNKSAILQNRSGSRIRHTKHQTTIVYLIHN